MLVGRTRVFGVLIVVWATLSAVASAQDRLQPIAHFRPAQGWLGDAHPIYTSNEWTLPYLQVPLQPLRNGLARVHNRVVVTTDVLRWSEKQIPNNQVGQAWWLIANVIHNGTWYSYYNGETGMCLATSTNQTNWTPYAGNPVIPYSSIPAGYELRDPSVFRNDLTNEWWLVIAGKRPGNIPYEQSGLFWVSKSTDLFTWTTPTILHQPNNIGVPECPELFKIGSKYYLIGSWGSGRVGQGRYRVADNPAGPWNVPPVDTLDGPEIMAPNSAQGPGRRLFFGWIPTYTNNQDYGQWEWGGHLAFPREMYTDGSTGMYLRAPAELLNLRTTSRTFSDADSFQTISGSWQALPTGAQLGSTPFVTRAETRLPQTWPRFELVTTVTITGGSPRAGIALRRGGASHAGYELLIDVAQQKLILRAVGDSRSIAEKPIVVPTAQPIALRVFLDGDIVEAFVNDEWSLAGRVQNSTTGDQVGLFAENANSAANATANFTWPTIYGINAVYPDPQATTATTLPAAGPPGQGFSAGFPSYAANMYCPYDPQLNFASSFTLETWVKITPGTSGFKSHLIVKGDGSSPGYHYGLELLPDRSFNFFYRTTGGGFDGCASPAFSVPEGTWTHLAAVLDRASSEIRLYKNGSRVATRTGVTTALDTTNNGALRLGFPSGLTASEQHYGLVDSVRIWNSARTDANMFQTWNRELTSAERTNMVIDWNMSRIQPETASPNRLYVPNQVSALPQLVARCFDGAVMFADSPTVDPAPPPQSAKFTTTGSNVYTPFQSALNFTSGFSLEAWVKMDAASAGNKGNLIVKGDGASPGYHYGLNVLPNQSLELYYRNDQLQFEGHSSAAGTIPVGTWTHVAGVVDLAANQIRLYKNGQLIATKSVSLRPLDRTNQGALRCGYASGFPNGDRYYGSIDEVRVWSSSRTSSEIFSNFDKALPAAADPALVVNWHFDNWQLEPGTPQRISTPNLSSNHSDLRAILYDGAINTEDSAPVSSSSQIPNWRAY